MRIAELRENITFKQVVETDDGAGGAFTSIEDVLTTRAQVQPLSATKALEGSQQAYNQAYEIRIRKRQNFTPEGGMYIDYRGRLLIINQAADDNEDHRFQVIRAVTKDPANG